MLKYLRIRYNGKKVILSIDGCHNCPLMRFNQDRMTCNCRIFGDKKKGDNTVDHWTVNYNSYGTVFDKIEIPKWCKLSNSMTDLFFDKNLYIPSPTSIMIDSSHDHNDTFNDVINMKEERLVNVNIVYKIVTSNSSSTINRNNLEDFDDYPFLDDNYTPYSELDSNVDFNKPEYNICSYCGKPHNTVDRTKNNGMCDGCYSENKNDKYKMSLSYINNFRLKRNIKLLDKEVKII